MTFVSDLEPQALWKHFDAILTIPRASKDEGAMRRYVIETAERHGLATRVDPAGNLVVRKPASPGHEDAPVTVLQSHLDMVEEKNSDVDHDFRTDPIAPVRDGDYLTADGTTLGSDNGIGVAAMLAVLESDSLTHGPLELLFTIDEETGLTGASELAGDLLAGRRLLNLDTEEEGALYVGCAGGVGSRLELPIGRAATPAGTAALSFKVSGFKGGHSGVDIHLQRGNAVKALGRSLAAGARAADALPTAVNPQITDAVTRAGTAPAALRLAALAGGSAHNAIPREAAATVVVDQAAAGDLRGAVEREFAAIAAEVRAADPGARLEVSEPAVPAEAWDAATTGRALRLLEALPHGVQSMSYDIPELVETSCNLATVTEEGGALVALLSSRSSVESAKEALARRIRSIGELAGAAASEEGGYPGWKPDMSSRLLEVLKEVHRRELGSEPAIKAIHAGLETGIIGEKYPGMDMISFGPQIEFPHSPDERVHVASVERFWRLLTATLAELA
jgi:dipeptidase D